MGEKDMTFELEDYEVFKIIKKWDQNNENSSKNQQINKK